MTVLRNFIFLVVLFVLHSCKTSSIINKSKYPQPLTLEYNHCIDEQQQRILFDSYLEDSVITGLTKLADSNACKFNFNLMPGKKIGLQYILRKSFLSKTEEKNSYLYLYRGNKSLLACDTLVKRIDSRVTLSKQFFARRFSLLITTVKYEYKIL